MEAPHGGLSAFQVHKTAKNYYSLQIFPGAFFENFATMGSKNFTHTLPVNGVILGSEKLVTPGQLV